jgi:sugar lactone lactonase YvrE
MAIGPDGSIYAMANKELGIQIYDQKGRLQREIPLASLPISSPHQCRIAVDRNGDIYFTDSYGIVRLDAQGRPLARWLMYGGDRPLSGCDVAVRNGVVYVIAGYLGGEIQIFTPDGQCIARYVRPKLPLELPWAIAVQPDGSYAVEQAATPWPADSCLLFDAAGHQTGSIRGLMCSGFATRPAGGYYGIGYNGIKRVDASGENVVTIVGNQDVDGVFTQGAVDPATGNLWALSASKELVVFGPDDKLMKRVTLAKETDLSPREIFMAIDPSGFIYFSDVPKHHIVKCDFNGNVVGVIGKLGSGLGELRRPKGLTVDSEGRLIVADTRNHRIQAFSPDGTPLGVWGKLGHGEGELDRPTNVALSPDTLFIADTHNDRVVKVRLSDFWQEVSKDIKPAPPFVAPKKEPVPVPGEVTVEGIVVAGTDDFTDGIYIESADRAWGVKISLPEGARALQGQRCRVRGILELKERAARHLRARSIELVSAEMSALGPLGMANLYMGDGYRAGDRPTDLSNLGLLVKTWGRVISVDVANKCLVVNDGSYTGENAGLQVYAGNLRSPLAVWPDVGQYVGVTGISTSRPRGDGTFGPAIRVRGDDDIEIFAE